MVAVKCVRSCSERRLSMKEVARCLGELLNSWNGLSNPCIMGEDVDIVETPSKNQQLEVNDPVAMKQLSKAGEMPSLEPPDDESIRTLYVGGLDARITEQDLRNNFYAHGEIVVNDPVAMKQLSKAGEMPSLEPPDDESIRTLYVGGLDARITEQDLRNNFYAHGEIVVNDPVAMKQLSKAGEMPSLEPPDDESIRTLYVGRLDARITEQDLRNNFYAHGEIVSV
ncbi:uncharacterized protein LOC121808938 [Salvia splendens]|uniref:uncharacterized protein LOC121808938 n=1 Tax=Salvia splendens TaxID=180675 RepID=UPI001C2709E9|nr:uncharacterized protein LOC121808938 [Salvia splendens]